MKKIYTLAALFVFSASAAASEGDTLFDSIDAALAVAGPGGGVSYSYGEGMSLLDEASQIAGIETMAEPVSIGDIDLYYSADSAVGSLFDAE